MSTEITTTDPVELANEIGSSIEAVPPEINDQPAVVPAPEVAGEMIAETLERAASVDADEGPTPVRKSTGKRSTRRRKTRESAAAVDKPITASKAINGMLPTTERIHVRKRNNDGKLVYINHFSPNDLVNSGTIEAFLIKYVVPQWGHGEFHLYLQKGEKVQPYGSVTLAEPVNKSEDVSSLQQLLVAQQHMNQQAESRATSSLDEMTKLITLSDKLSGSNGNGKGGLDPMMMMMMMQMNQQQQKPQTPDPILSALIQKIENLEQQQSMNSMPLPPPPPPPPPAPDPMNTIGPMLQGFMDTMSKVVEASKQPPPPQRDVIGEIAAMSKLFKSDDESDKLTTKDAIQMLPQLKDLLIPKGTDEDPLDKTLKQMRLIHMLKQDMFGEAPQAQAPTQGASFWDALVAMFSSGAGSKISEAIQGEMSKRMGGEHPSEEYKALPAQQHPPSLPAPSEPQDGDATLIPDGFREHAEKINSAETVAERIGELITGLQYLVNESSHLRNYIIQMMTSAKANHKEQTIGMLEAMLTAFEESEILTPQAVEECLAGFREYWVVICQKLGFKHITKDPEAEEQPAQAGDKAEIDPEEEGLELATAGIEATGIEIEEEGDSEIDPSEIQNEEPIEVEAAHAKGNGVPVQQEQGSPRQQRIIEADSAL